MRKNLIKLLDLLHCKKEGKKDHKKLDVDPQRDDDASPMSTYRCMLRPT